MSLELQSALRDGGTVARMALHALVFDRVADNGALLAYAAQRAFCGKLGSTIEARDVVREKKGVSEGLWFISAALFDPATQIIGWPAIY